MTPNCDFLFSHELGAGESGHTWEKMTEKAQHISLSTAGCGNPLGLAFYVRKKDLG